ncbi:unnamed protein product [Kluyveromyces dobzhanskii CBS 2104]|uniref:Spindle pole component BBP1 n=1 Tax=Kluyveromyces dobzhanskii CBS 2104 TaxID=1427455 RepID=A0A0A8L968_9SACH|nr:unnamed protein product [Kluyveromyces dobzhanskii CBS 2104]
MGEDNTGGIFKWTIDALFKREASPSAMYDKRIQEDSFDQETYQRPRASSSSELDIYSKYELLQDEEEPDLLRPISMNGLPDEKQDTNTFHARRARDKKVRDTPSIRRAPNLSDPIISKLFQVSEDEPQQDQRFFKPEERRDNNFLPGKFPSPTKNYDEPVLPKHQYVESDRRQNPVEVPAIRTVDYTPEYVRLMDRLSLNNKRLQDLKHDVKEGQKHGLEKETKLKQKYLQIRQELIQELKQSKMIYDNYCKLYYKYKEFKRSFQLPTQPLASSASMLDKIKSLENQVVDMSIENERLRKKSEEQILSLELQKQELQNKFEVEKMVYERRIKDLEEKVYDSQHRMQPATSTSPVSSSSFVPHTHETSDSTASPYKEYNNTIDTQFLRNLVK